MSENNVIGSHGGIPWQGEMPADMQRFRSLTEGHIIILGQRTFSEFLEPLANRKHVVLTYGNQKSNEGVTYVRSIDEALEFDSEDEEVFVIGGGKIFAQMLPYCQKIYLTVVHNKFYGDSFFPSILKSEWKIISQEKFEADEENAYGYTFLEYSRL